MYETSDYTVTYFIIVIISVHTYHIVLSSVFVYGIEHVLCSVFMWFIIFVYLLLFLRIHLYERMTYLFLLWFCVCLFVY